MVTAAHDRVSPLVPSDSGEFKQRCGWVVVRIGSKVRRFKIGDEVYARPCQDRIGTFAEFIAMNENYVAMKPRR
jgi:hypothetical protein